MGDKEDGHSLALELTDLGQTFVLKCFIAHGQDFVNQQDVGINVDGYSKP